MAPGVCPKVSDRLIDGEVASRNCSMLITYTGQVSLDHTAGKRIGSWRSAHGGNRVGDESDSRRAFRLPRCSHDFRMDVNSVDDQPHR